MGLINKLLGNKDDLGADRGTMDQQKARIKRAQEEAKREAAREVRDKKIEKKKKRAKKKAKVKERGLLGNAKALASKAEDTLDEFDAEAVDESNRRTANRASGGGAGSFLDDSGSSNTAGDGFLDDELTGDSNNDDMLDF
jgi:hypothetical protein